jgi:hypothetical protein
VLLAVGVTLFASTPVQAKSWTIVQLWNTGAEPDAFGEAKLGPSKLTRPDPRNPVYDTRVSISCHNLTPGATYSTPVGDFIADAGGDGKVTGRTAVCYGWMLFVDRLDPDGSVRVFEYWS